MNLLHLRPHHLLCLRFFEGKGYSEDFVTRMYEVTEQLCDDPVIVLTDGCDDICVACPHREGGVCRFAQKVGLYDSRVLHCLRLKPGDRLRWQELCDQVDERILTPRKLDAICRGCQWISVCRNNQRLSE